MTKVWVAQLHNHYSGGYDTQVQVYRSEEAAIKALIDQAAVSLNGDDSAVTILIDALALPRLQERYEALWTYLDRTTKKHGFTVDLAQAEIREEDAA